MVSTRDEDLYIMKSGRRRGAKSETVKWGISYKEGSDLAPWFNAIWLADQVSRMLLDVHRDAILAGKKASGGQQRPLDPDGRQGALAKKGRRPDVRGNTGRSEGRTFPNMIKRTKLRVGQGKRIGNKRLGTVAQTKIVPHSAHRKFLEREFENGVEYFYTEGEVEDRLDALLEQWLDQALSGPPRKDPGEGEVEARDVK